MSEALSKEKNIYYSTLQNISLISKFPILSKARIYFANYSRLSFPFDGQRNSRAFFEFQPPEPSNILFYSMPLSKRASSLIFSHFEVTHIRSNRHQQRFPEVYLIQKFAHTEKLQYHRSNPTIYELLRTEPHDPSYYDLQDRRSLPCQQSIENHCPSPI